MMFVQSSGQAQSGPETTRSGAKNEILSSMVTALPSQPRTAGEPYLPTPAQKFVCNTGYSQTNCNEQVRSEEHTSELQSHSDLVCRLLLEKKKKETSTKT